MRKQMEKHGLDQSKLKISDGAIYAILDFYTREAGVRNLERKIGEICRKAARQLVSGEEEMVRVTERTIEKFLGPKRIKPDEISGRDEVGVVNGLAWTQVGGEMLQVEVAVLEGNGKIQLTGSLGDVMKESAQAAISYVRSVADRYGIEHDFYKTKDIHIHVPEGAVPKDGPSAGVTMTTAIVSALTGIPVKGKVAMTGEVTLRGRVLPIGGLREKTMAAFRNHITTVIIPKQNLSDLSEIDELINSRADRWKTGRMAKAELAIIRLAVYEMKYEEEIPVSVAINEAVELAKIYGTDQGAGFVNGILAKLA